jgi:CubicO group peptidase (beta-lactamase class C family)
MGIMILADQHKLLFDDAWSKFCPEFPDYARKITMRQLLNHTSGLREYHKLLTAEPFDDNFFHSSKSAPAPHEFTAAEALQALSRQQKLLFPPGEK